MAKKEAAARIKINKHLESSGWRFFDDKDGPANIVLENNIKITKDYVDDLGDDFQKKKNGYIDFLLLNSKGFPLVVLEAKSESKNPLVGKEQARRYAKSVNCRFVILSNGNLHYFWDLQHGNPYIITTFPRPESITGYVKHNPDPTRLINELINDDYIAITQYPNYQNTAAWKNEVERESFCQTNSLRFLRPYQKNAILALQNSVKEGNNRFLFEMATGTGKTLVSAGVIKLFLRTGNAHRVLFLVDRLELEDQAFKSFKILIKNDYKTVIYKENRDDWRKAEIMVTTVQSLLFDNKYQKLFSPTDFDLVISDEAHRSIGGNSRAVFEYFIGYKLGLTATPKDYIKNGDKDKGNQIGNTERRHLLDTYRTFGCESGIPTFRYSLIDGIKEGYLINPIVVDARSEVSTQLLSDKGYVVPITTDEGDEEAIYRQRDFEKKFLSESTNQIFCKAFIENGLLDPISQEFGKSIVFSVSQNHARKLTQILNEMAHIRYPGKYNSDFAVQVTSEITDAQQFTINFTNNKLLGSGNFLEAYKTSKARICVTVGMMTTGYDCPDLLNLAMMRPIFSPTDFIQIKGRGTRKHNFFLQLFDEGRKDHVQHPEKKHFKLFDFFGNVEYFEEKFDYDEKLKLPNKSTFRGGGENPQPVAGEYENFNPDILATLSEVTVSLEGMKIDRMFFEKFEDLVKDDPFIKGNVQAGMWEVVINYIHNNLLNKPQDYFTLDKLRKAALVDRRLGMREIVEKAYGIIPDFKSKDQLLEEEFQKFIADYKPESPADILPMKYYFKAYITDSILREIIESKQFTGLNTNPSFGISDFKAVPDKWRRLIPEYVKDYVPINQFMS